MIREIISPKTHQIIITIPACMVNQALELLVFPIGKVQNELTEKKQTKLLMEQVFKKADSIKIPDTFNFDKMMNDALS